MFNGLIIEKNKGILYSGKMTEKTVTEILDVIPYAFPGLDKTFVTRKRIASIVIELLNNIINHTEGKGSIEISCKGKKHYTVKSSNVITEKNLKPIKKYIKNINKSKTDEIARLKNKYLFENPLSGNNAGLGLFEVALYSSKLDLKVKKLQKQLYLYTIESEIR